MPSTCDCCVVRAARMRVQYSKIEGYCLILWQLRNPHEDHHLRQRGSVCSRLACSCCVAWMPVSQRQAQGRSSTLDSDSARSAGHRKQTPCIPVPRTRSTTPLLWCGFSLHTIVVLLQMQRFAHSLRTTRQRGKGDLQSEETLCLL